MENIKKKKEIIRFRNKKKKAFPWKILWIAIPVIVVVVLGIILIKDYFQTDETVETIEETEEDKQNKYVGPADHEDRGEWVDPIAYYGIYTEDGVYSKDPISAMFSDERLGIVPTGLKLEAAFLSYEDFQPYNSLTDYAFISSYQCDANPETIQMELGVDAEKMQLQGSYSTKKESDTYSGNIQLDISNVSYYIRNIFDSDNLSVGSEEGNQGKGLYGYLEPNFKFEYSGSFTSNIEGSKNGTISSQFSGTLTQDMWSFTTNLSGQGKETFPQGEVYIRCKIPCTCEKIKNGSKTLVDSYVNLYFSILECRIGTRIDAMPEHALETN